MTHHAHEAAPVTITSARQSHSADLRRREIKYLISMGVRTACFILAVVTTGPVRWCFVAAAVFLPYVAVVVANARDQRGGAAGPPFAGDDKPQIEAGQTPRDSDPKGV